MNLFLTPIIHIWTWFKTQVIDHTKDAAKIAITITETAKALLQSPEVGFLLNLADAITHSQLPSNIAAIVAGNIPKALAAELAIVGLPDNATEADVLEFEQRIMAAFNVTDDKSKLYTTFAAQVYGDIKEATADGKVTFGEAVTEIEKAYQQYKTDIATNTAAIDIGVVQAAIGTKLPDGNIVLDDKAA